MYVSLPVNIQDQYLIFYKFCLIFISNVWQAIDLLGKYFKHITVGRDNDFDLSLGAICGHLENIYNNILKNVTACFKIRSDLECSSSMFNKHTICKNFT